MVDGGSEWSDVRGGIISDVTVEWDELEEVLVYVFLLQAPKLLVVLVNDSVLVWVVVGGGGASGGGEELGKEIGCNRAGRVFDGKRWERSGCLWSGGTGRRYSLDGGGVNRFGECLDCNVVEGDVVAEVVTKVGVDVGVLSGGNRWSVLLLLKTGDGLVDET